MKNPFKLSSSVALSRTIENIERIKSEVSPLEKSREKDGCAGQNAKTIGLRSCGIHQVVF